MSWEEARARLEELVSDDPRWTDIRAALERDEEHGDRWLKLWNEHQASKAECAALRQRVEEQQDTIDAQRGRLKELQDRVEELERFKQEDIRAAEKRAEAAEAEVKRLRDIISPGDAAAYEEGMAALKAERDGWYLTSKETAERLSAVEAKLAKVFGVVESMRATHDTVDELDLIDDILAAAKGE